MPRDLLFQVTGVFSLRLFKQDDFQQTQGQLAGLGVEATVPLHGTSYLVISQGSLALCQLQDPPAQPPPFSAGQVHRLDRVRPIGQPMAKPVPKASAVRESGRPAPQQGYWVDLPVLAKTLTKAQYQVYKVFGTKVITQLRHKRVHNTEHGGVDWNVFLPRVRTRLAQFADWWNDNKELMEMLGKITRKSALSALV